MNKFIRKKKELEESGKNFKDFVHDLNFLVQVVGSKGEFIYVNKKWKRILGYTEKDLRKINLFDIIRKDQIPHRKKLFREIIKGNRVNNIEAVFISKKGKEVIVEGSVVSTFKNGKFLFAKGIFNDITTKKEIENIARQSKEKYERIFNNSPAAIVILDAKGNVIDLNNRLKDWLKYKSKDVIGKNVLNIPFIPLRSKIVAAKKIAQRISGKELDPYELEFIAKNGEKKIGLIDASPVKNEKGKMIRDIVTIYDVTEFNKIKDKLKESQEIFESIVSSAQDAIVMIDNNGCATYWNKAAERIFDYEKSEIIGKNMHHILAPDKYRKHYEKGFRKFNKTGEGNAIGKVTELSGIKKNGIEFPIELSLSSVRINGKWNAIGIIRDITKRKEVDNMKKEFISMASHQLKTPLTAISWFVEILNDEKIGSLNERQKELVKDIYTSTKQEIKLVNDLLNLSRLEGGSIRIEPKKNQYESIINSVIKKKKLLAEKRRCKLLFKKPKKRLPFIPLDKFLLEEIIDNLVANAIYYSKPESQVTVELKKRSSDYLLVVSNEGIGISKEEHKNIFKKFFRAKNAKKKEQNGSGLGLYIVKKIIETSGGKIWFDSEKNKGAKFYLSIPLSGMKKKKGSKKLL